MPSRRIPVLARLTAASRDRRAVRHRDLFFLESADASFGCVATTVAALKTTLSCNPFDEGTSDHEP
jgi:hypothetical protein